MPILVAAHLNPLREKFIKSQIVLFMKHQNIMEIFWFFFYREPSIFGIDRLQSNSTDACSSSWLLQNSNMATLSPARSPGVSDNPVVTLISDDLYTVIKIGSASRAVNDTSAVELEDIWVCLDAHGNRLLRHSSRELIIVFGRNLSVSTRLEHNLGRVVLAFLVPCLIWIVWWLHYSILHHIIKSWIWIVGKAENRKKF
jgi:hypothetical protein